MVALPLDHDEVGRMGFDNVHGKASGKIGEVPRNVTSRLETPVRPSRCEIGRELIGISDGFVDIRDRWISDYARAAVTRLDQLDRGA